MNQIRYKKLTVWYDKLSFLGIFVLWTSIITIFGLIYQYLSTDQSYLFYVYRGEEVNHILDSVYFSFITATSTGFGDIIPMGYFKVIAIFEVIFGLVLLALITSKLVSIKQNVAINEIYEISFYEKINRIRSSMLVFRQNLGRLLEKIEEKVIRRRDISETYNYLSSFDNILNEINILIQMPESEFKKSIDPVNAELIFHSMMSSYEKLVEVLSMMNENNIEWKREVTLNILDKCMVTTDEIFNKLKFANILNEKATEDVIQQSNEAIENLRIQIKK